MRLKGFYLVLIRLVIAFVPLYLLYYSLFLSVASYHTGVVSSSTGLKLWFLSLLSNLGGLFDSWNNFTALAVSKVISLFGIHSLQRANDIILQVGGRDQVIRVDWSCNILLPYFSYLATVIALLNISLRQRTLGALGGFFLIYIGNVFRIATLAMVGSWFGRGAMDGYHVAVFNTGLTVWTMLVFFAWITAIGGGEILGRSLGMEEPPD